MLAKYRAHRNPYIRILRRYRHGLPPPLGAGNDAPLGAEFEHRQVRRRSPKRGWGGGYRHSFRRGDRGGRGEHPPPRQPRPQWRCPHGPVYRVFPSLRLLRLPTSSPLDHPPSGSHTVTRRALSRLETRASQTPSQKGKSLPAPSVLELRALRERRTSRESAPLPIVQNALSPNNKRYTRVLNMRDTR